MKAIPDHRTLARVVASKASFVLDLDGVVYRGKEVIPGAPEAISRLRRAGKRVLYLTNNSTRTRDAYVELLRSMGIEASIKDIFTSASLTAGWLVSHIKASGVDPERVTVYVIGEDGIKTDLHDSGFVVAKEQAFEGDNPGYKSVRFVIVGLDRQFTYQKLHIALNCINCGASFLATNDDASLPVEGGSLAPGAGALVQALATCSKHPPDFGSPFGKPNPLAFHEIARATGIPMGAIASIGDRLETDILASKRAGITSLLVLSGITRLGDGIPDDMAPDAVLESIDAFNNDGVC